MKIVIIGAGPAGVSVVETLRSYDRQSEIVMFSAEPYPPYSPPAMADHFMCDSKAHLWRDEDWAERMDVDYRMGQAVDQVLHEKHQVRAGDHLIPYDRLVIATGGRLYAPLQNAHLPGVYNFKSLSAAEALVGRVKSGAARTALIVGAGFIGMEIAMLLRRLGVSVTQVEMMNQVMPAMLDADTAALALKLMRQQGVDVRLGVRAKSFIGKSRATGIELEDGRTLEADLVIAATGVRPNLDFLTGSGIAYNWGLAVDEHLRTNHADIYAAGDVVEVPDRLTGEVYVHAIFPNAVEQGRVVGLNLCGFDVCYEGADRMNSLKHLGLAIMAAGLKEGDEVLKARRDGGLRTLYLKDNRLVGFQLVGDIHPAGVLRALINSHQDVRRLKDRLLEPNMGQGTIIWQAINPG